MATLRADRRLYVTADRSQVVEEGDPRGAWLLAGIDGQIGEGDVAKYGLYKRGGRVRYDGAPELDDLETKMVQEPEAKPAQPGAKVMRFGGDEAADGVAPDGEHENDGAAAAASTLPDDIPGREELLAAGLSTIEAVAAHADLTDVGGIGKVTAAKIADYLSAQEGSDEDDAGDA